MRRTDITDVEFLRSLTGTELDDHAYRLVMLERGNQAKLIAHLAEIDERKLYAGLGYSSLFDYCVKRLRLSRGTTFLRTQVARLCRRFPVVLERIASNTVSLTVAGRIAPHINEGNCLKLLNECAGMTRDEVEAYLVQIAPKPLVNSGMTRQRAPRTEPTEQPVESAGEGLFSAPDIDHAQEPSSLGTESKGPAVPPRVPPVQPVPPVRRRDPLEPAQPGLTNVRFVMDDQLRQKLERLAEVEGIQNVGAHLAELVEMAVDVALDKKDPQKKAERRKAREAKKATKAEHVNVGPSSPKPDEGDTDTSEIVSGDQYIPAELRAKVMEDSGYQCEFVGSTGVRCSQRRWLEVDHIDPRGRGGRTKRKNLRCLCRAHNQFAAERVFGVKFMERKRAGIGDGLARRASC